jgi:hypothetical protein
MHKTAKSCSLKFKFVILEREISPIVINTKDILTHFHGYEIGLELVL